MREDVDALESLTTDDRLTALEDLTIDDRLAALERGYFQSVSVTRGTQGSANVDYPWFAGGTDVLSVAAGAYRITACYDISPTGSANQSTILRIALTTTGTVTRMRCVVVADVERVTNVTRLTAVNTNEQMYLTPQNNLNLNLRGHIEGYIIFSTAGTIMPVFSWSANCVLADTGTDVNVNTGTFFELRGISNALDGWS
jgi:hypothetical protein